MKKTFALGTILWGIAIFLGVTWKNIEGSTNEIKEIPRIQSETEKNPEVLGGIVYIYVPTKSKTKLEKEELVITDSTTKETIVNEVIKGIINKLEESGAVKKDKYSYTAYLEGRDLYIDIDSRIFTQAKNVKEEMLVVYSFVNTFTNIGGIDRVKFLVDGKSANKINFVNLSGFYEKNMAM